MQCPKVTPRVWQAVLSGARRPRRHWEGPGRVEGTLVPAAGHLQRGPGHLLASVLSRVVCDAPCARVENHPSGTAVTLPAAPSGPSRSRFCSRESSVVHSFLFPVTRRAVTLPRDDLEGASQVDPWSAPWGDRRAGGMGRGPDQAFQ